jgi:hypothetical protein
LLEDQRYKERVRGGDVFGTLGAVLGASRAPNPLRGDIDRRRGYEGMNRDSGWFDRVSVCIAEFLASYHRAQDHARAACVKTSWPITPSVHLRLSDRRLLSACP